MTSASTPFSDAFSLMGLNRTFSLDIQDLEAKYRVLSKLTHPDLLPNTSTRGKLEATIATANLNEAYETLKDPLKRGYHLLSLLAFHLKADQEHTLKDPQLLAETFEDSTALEEATTQAILDRLIITLTQKHERCLETITQAFATKDYPTAQLNLYRYRYYTKVLKDATGKRQSHALTA
jgi:molecular chaperone HscB